MFAVCLSIAVAVIITHPTGMTKAQEFSMHVEWRVFITAVVVFNFGFLFWKQWQLTQCNDYTIKRTTTEQWCDSWKEQDFSLFQFLQTSTGFHPVYYPTDTGGVLFWKQSSQGMILTIHWQVVQELRTVQCAFPFLKWCLTKYKAIFYFSLYFFLTSRKA